MPPKRKLEEDPPGLQSQPKKQRKGNPKICYYCLTPIDAHLNRHLKSHGINDPTLHSKVTAFLESPANTDKEKEISETYKKAITHAKGLSIFSRVKRQHGQPYLFPATQCRAQEVSDKQMLNMALNDFSIHKSQVYSFDEPSAPEKEPMIVDVLDLLYKLDSTSQKYAMNLACKDGVNLPRDFQHEPTISEMETYLNITPQRTYTDLHHDQGNHGITTLGRGCIKLWALYPMTGKNLAIWDEHRKSPFIFRDTVDKLELGEVVVHNSDEAIYLPPGCLHSTYTLDGGIVPGIIFTTPKCLSAVIDLINIEACHYEKPSPGDIQALLETLIVCLAPESGKRDEALKALCELPKINGLKSHQLFTKLETGMGIEKKMRQEAKCTICRKMWTHHSCFKR